MRYYIVGIGGVAMASLAGLLKSKGHAVAGSDSDALYEPMKSVLADSHIPVFTPYSENNISKWKPDIVVVGNAISRGNPELEYVLSHNLPYKSVVDVLREEFIEGRHSLVVAGTHGKTTTSALLAWILEYAKKDPTVFIGGSTKNFTTGYKFGRGKHVVLEGDEYDTCFFDKNPKFLGYRPFVGVVNNIELDHIDIYRDLDHIKSAFRNFIKLIPQNGLLVINREDKNAWGLIDESDPVKSRKRDHGASKRQVIWRGAEPNIVTFGIKKGDYTAQNIRQTKNYMGFVVLYKNKRLGTIKTSLTGTHNVLNILTTIAVAQFIGIPFSKAQKAIALFEGVKRRAEVLGTVHKITIIDDYAHHPTAVKTTLEGLHAQFPKKRLIALFEPSSASSRRKIFEKEYIAAFKNADHLLIYKPYNAQQLKSDQLFNGKEVAQKISENGTPAEYIEDMELFLARIKEITRKGDVIVIMSCRNFDGLREKILNLSFPT